MHAATIAQPIAVLVLAPLLVGVVNRVKAWFGGRRGRPLLQGYYDLGKLLRKGAVYSDTSSWVVRAGPVVGLAATLCALVFVPAGRVPSVLSFGWDMVAVAYLLGLARFFTMSAALDTGSAFEGMGASREAQFSALAEPALILLLAATSRAVDQGNALSDFLGRIDAASWSTHAPTLTLAAAAMLIVFLAENSRVPFDDPNTHLELTMVHEVMILDHGGPDLAFILYGASIKMWLLASLLVGIALPFRTGNPWTDLLVAVASVFAVALSVGAIESTMARLRFVRLPALLVASTVFAILAFVLQGA